MQNILIRGPNWVGDAVLAIPAMKAVREHFRNAQITLLVRPWVAGLFTSAPFVDRVWSEPRPSSIAEWSRITRAIRDRHFDLAVLFPNSFESALMMFAGRVPNRFGYATDGRSLLLTNAITRTDSGNEAHQVHYYLDLVKNFFKPDKDPSIEIDATAQERAEARRLLAEHGIERQDRFLVLNPGAAYGSAKRWDELRFAEAGDRFAKEFGLSVAVIGSASEIPAAERVRAQMKSPAAILSGKTTLETLMGVLAECSLMITNDSGPMHIAAALGTPTVAVFGSTDERVTGPVGAQTRIVKTPVDCSPCLLRECPIDHRCMERVSVSDVYRAARELLQHA
jgi:heptosyltransferase-2